MRAAVGLLFLVWACRGANEPRTGGVIAQYGNATAKFDDFRTRLIANRFLDTIASRVNQSIRVPERLTLATGHCDVPTASYEPATRRVTLCYELFETLAARFAGDESADYLVAGTITFALMHELAHALIDQLSLPITGREEDAADQLATLLLLDQGPAGDTLAFGAAGWFAVSGDSATVDELAFADDHGLNQQRVYNIVCWIYGRDPRRYPDIVARQLLPEHRRERCPAEYARMSSSWGQLLEPHRRRS